MTVADRALWYIESHLGRGLTLAGIAADVGVTPFHLSRAFTAQTGQPLMRHVWRRRLTRAALALGEGRGSVLQVALDAGYGSPEAFSRAFRAEFGRLPKSVRSPPEAAALPLTHAILIQGARAMLLDEPTFETRPDREVAGPSRRYDMRTRAAIPAQWAAYNDDGTRVERPVGDAYYGVCHDFDGNDGFGYLCGQEVVPGAALPDGFARVALPAGRWARFRCGGHISTMGDAWSEVWGTWMERLGCTPRPGTVVEVYPPAFDPVTGDGGYELWVPVA
jgi:AraC family transcriptional regulator